MDSGFIGFTQFEKDIVLGDRVNKLDKFKIIR